MEMNIDEITRKQKEKWHKLEELLRSVAKQRELKSNPQVVPEKNGDKVGMKINPMQMPQIMQQRFFKEVLPVQAANVVDPTNSILNSVVVPLRTSSSPSISSSSILSKASSLATSSTAEVNGTSTPYQKLSVNVPIGLHKLFYHKNVNKKAAVQANDYTSIQDTNSNATEKGNQLKYKQSTVSKKHPQRTRIPKQNSKVLESINYVLPIGSFDKFKVILPKSKLEVKTFDGSKLVVARNSSSKNNIDVQNSALSEESSEPCNDSMLKHPKSSLSVLELLTRERAGLKSKLPSIYMNRKFLDDYMYCTTTKKFVIDSMTGMISCHDINTESKIQDTKKIFHQSNQLLVPNSTWISETYTKKLLKQYKSISTSVKRVASETLTNGGRLTLKRLKNNDAERCEESCHYVILSTKFGSFVQKKNQQAYTTDNMTKDLKISRHFPRKLEEEELLVSLEQLLPTYMKTEGKESSVVIHAIIYIQELEEKIKVLLNQNSHDEKIQHTSSYSPPSLSCSSSFTISSYTTMCDANICDEDPLLPFNMDNDNSNIQSLSYFSPHFSLECSEVIQPEKLMSFEDLSKSVLDGSNSLCCSFENLSHKQFFQVEDCESIDSLAIEQSRNCSPNAIEKDLWTMENTWSYSNLLGNVMATCDRDDCLVYSDVNLHSSSQCSSAFNITSDFPSDLFPMLAQASGEMNLLSPRSSELPLTDHLLPRRDLNRQ